MASLNVDLDFFEHPKTKRLVRLLGRGSEVVPLRLWAYTARYFPADGRLAEIAAQEIESECRWWGKEGDAVNALVECRFLDLEDGTYVVHDWQEHEGHISAFRDRARAGAKARWKNAYASSNATSIPPSIACSNASSNASALPALPAFQTPPPHARSHGVFGQPFEIRNAAAQAISDWSRLPPPIGRGHPLDELKDEHTICWNLTEELATEPPIARGDDLVPRQNLIAQAAAAMRKSKRQFKSVKFAVGCVRAALEEWATAGMPNGEHKPGKRSRVDEQMSVIDRALETK